jgi:hypothetical protein
MKRRDKINFLYNYLKHDVREMFYKDKERTTVCILVKGWHVPSWEPDSGWDYGGAGTRITNIAWNYFGLKAWIITTSQKGYWSRLKATLNPKPEDIFGITVVRKHKGKTMKLKMKR